MGCLKISWLSWKQIPFKMSGRDTVELFLWECFALYRNWEQASCWKVVQIKKGKISYYFCPWNQWVLLRVRFVFHFRKGPSHMKICFHFLWYKVRRTFSWKKFCVLMLSWYGCKQIKDLTLKPSYDSHRRNSYRATEAELEGCCSHHRGTAHTVSLNPLLPS